MFAFNEALMDWMTVNDLQQASEMISVSKQFCDIYKNKVKQIEPFIHNSFLHISGKIINLITKQVKHCLDAKFPRYVFNHETKKWIALSDLPQELIKGATSILLKGNILKVVVITNQKSCFVGNYHISDSKNQNGIERMWNLSNSGNVIPFLNGEGYLTVVPYHFWIWNEKLGISKTAKLSIKTISDIAIIKHEENNFTIQYLHEGSLKELTM